MATTFDRRLLEVPDMKNSTGKDKVKLSLAIAFTRWNILNTRKEVFVKRKSPGVMTTIRESKELP